MSKLSVLIGAMSVMFLFSSCIKDKCSRVMTYTKYEPIYVSYDDVRQPIEVEGARTIKNPGKIYVYDNYIYINERDKGVHIIDNSNASNPQNIGFINIPGNLDIAVKNNVMYADNYMDLVALNLNSPTKVQMLKRVENVFPTFGEDPELGILVRYNEEEVTEDVQCSETWRIEQEQMWGPQFNSADVTTMASTTGGNANAAGAGTAGRESGGGLGGSMARFSIYRDYLYTVDNQQLHVFNIAALDDPTQLNTVSLGWGIETIMPYQDKLFVGTNTGVLIYNNQVPTNPTYISQFNHASSCDPVFIENDFAYVTLRSGTRCEGFSNQLDILDVADVFNPTLVKTYEMTNPHGLSVNDNIMYLCDGDDGLKVYDVTDKMNVDKNQLFHDANKPTYDVIVTPTRNLLLVIGDDGLYQYDRSNPNSLIQLSHIPVEK
ncbi:MAG: hypothetical protein GY810_26535 [Aureispira sp.]|nr:hypothetical protein [Aureispira sp.]